MYIESVNKGDPYPIKVVLLGAKRILLEALTIGSKHPEVQIIQIITFDDSTDRRSRLSEIQRLSRVIIVKSPQEAREYLDSLDYDILLAVGWQWIIPSYLIQKAEIAALGVHYSPLPRLRGFAPTNWTIISDQKVAGVSIFKLTDQMDAGEIFFQETFELPRDIYVGELLKLLDGIAIKGMEILFESIALRRVETHPQDSEVPISIGLKRNRKHDVISWVSEAQLIARIVRGMSHPYRGAFTYSRDCELVIWRAEVVCGDIFYGDPGQIATITEGLPTILCGDGKILLVQEMELVHSNACKSNSDGHYLRLGETLGGVLP